MSFRNFLKTKFPTSILRLMNRLGLNKNFIPKKGKINFGDLYRTSPITRNYGYSRGGPVDRYYIEKFLKENETLIKGRVLEIGDNKYTLKYGKLKIYKSDILHIDEKNTNATYIGDLSDAPHLPADTFDCIILTQTLQFIYDFNAALKTCYRVLKPGGVLLLTVPGISNIGKDEWSWLWSFTANSITKLLSKVFSSKNVIVETHGNVLVATAFLYGIGLPEMKQSQMDEHDPSYQVIITGKAIK